MRIVFLKVCSIFFFLAVLSVVVGCASSKTQTTHFYILDPGEYTYLPGREIEQKTIPSVAITSFRLPQYLERPQIVTRSSENRLVLAEFHQWGGNLRKNMARVFAKNLSNLLNTPEIFIYPDIPPSPPDFRVELTVMKFERDADRKVRLSVQWRLTREHDRQHLKTQITDLESPSISEASDMTGTVRTMSRLLEELSIIISKELSTFADSR